MPHWDVPGEGYVVGFDQAPNWRVLSTQELKRKTRNRMGWYDDEGSEVGEIDAAQVYRVWSPHPRFSKTADSPTRHVLEPAEELILLSREVKARSQSRLNAGVWMIPSGLDLSEYEEEGVSPLDGFANQMVRKLSRPIADPGDPASLVPWVVEMDRDDIETAAKGLLSFSRDFETSSEDRKELLVRLATGLDLPAEVFLGLGNVSHWGQWMITEHAVSRHTAPTIDEILRSLTVNWFHPQVDLAPRFILWRDLAPATIPTDRSELTLKAHDRFLVSDETARGELDFGEDDAPSPEEIANRMQRVSARRGTVTDPATPSPSERPGMTAAISGVLATELAEIDRDLLAWTVVEAESELARSMKAEMNGVTAAVTEESFASFAERLSERIEQAQDAVRDYVSGLTDVEMAESNEETDRDAGVVLIIAALLAAVTNALFPVEAVPDPVSIGEVSDSPAPMAAIREGLSVAGGGRASFGPDAAELVGNGHRAVDALALRGYRTLSYRWVYGDPSSRAVNFEPHQNLDGRSFETWEDPSLRIFGAFPSGEFYRTGDHRGCQCSYVRELTLVPSLVPVG